MNEAAIIFAILAALVALRYAGHRAAAAAPMVRGSASSAPPRAAGAILLSRPPLPRFDATAAEVEENFTPALDSLLTAVLEPAPSAALPLPASASQGMRRKLKETVLRMASASYYPGGFHPHDFVRQRTRKRTPLPGLGAGGSLHVLHPSSQELCPA